MHHSFNLLQEEIFTGVCLEFQPGLTSMCQLTIFFNYRKNQVFLSMC